MLHENRGGSDRPTSLTARLRPHPPWPGLDAALGLRVEVDRHVTRRKGGATASRGVRRCQAGRRYNLEYRAKVRLLGFPWFSYVLL